MTAQLEIEKTAIAMLLAVPKRISTAIAMGLDGAHFSVPLHMRTFAVMREIWGTNQAIDIPTICRLLGDVVDNRAALLELRNAAPPTQNFEPYVTALLDYQRVGELRWVLRQAEQDLVNRRAMDSPAPLVANLAAAIAKFQGAGAALTTRPVSETFAKVVEAVEARMTSSPGISTGFPAVDDVMYGWQPGGLYILGARTSVGKTTLATNFAVAAAQKGHRTVFVTVEMSDIEITEKIVSQQCRVSLHKLKTGNISDADADRIIGGANNVVDLPLDICDMATPTMDHLENEILRLVRCCGVKFVVVDYLQLFQAGEERQRSQREEMQAVSSRFKRIARQNKIPLLVLSQLNRQTPATGHPDLTHLAESDQIGRDADVVMFLFQEDANRHGLSICKNRHGAVGSWALNSELETSRFGSKR